MFRRLTGIIGKGLPSTSCAVQPKSRSGSRVPHFDLPVRVQGKDRQRRRLKERRQVREALSALTESEPSVVTGSPNAC